MQPATPSRSDFRFFERLRVRWSEVDMQKIVFNGHYLMYIDTAMAAYWRALAMPYHETMEALQGDLYVRKATLEYEGSARYDDECLVGLRCARIGNSSMAFAAAVFRSEQRLVHGELVYVFADPSTQTSRPVPAALRDVLTGYERGEPMFECRLGSWAELGAQAQAIRHEVFTQELQIPAAMASDAGDETALHVLAMNRFGRPVATGRLLTSGPRCAALSRMAVRQPVRGSGVGQSILMALVQAAHERGDVELQVNAQRSAVGFYLRNGFAALGPAFDEAGIPHQALVRQLS